MLVQPDCSEQSNLRRARNLAIALLDAHSQRFDRNMLSSFYKKYSSQLLLLALAVFPLLHYHAETIPSNNNIEAWLPEKSEVRRQYDEFKLRFGAEEVILVGLDRSLGDDLIESIAGRIERSPGVRHCWTPQRMRDVMHELTVTDADIEQRLRIVHLAFR